MASISGVSSSNSIYGNRNVISGLASGMDTEAMIENSVAGYKAKITALSQKQTVLQWKQDSYRSMINKMVSLTQKYTSYTSSTNLFSSSFFDRAVNVTPGGANAGAVSATGKSNSTITVDGIKQLATNSKYVGSADGLGGGGIKDPITGETIRIEIAGDSAVDLKKPMELSTVSGNLTFAYGGKEVSISLGDTDIYNTTEELADAIREKLSEQKIATSSGELVSADKLIDVALSSDKKTINFTDAKGAGNNVYIKDASGKIATNDELALKPGESATSLTVNDPTKLKEANGTLGSHLSEKTMDITLDGVKKTITLPKYDDSVADSGKKFLDDLQLSLNDAFGVDKIKVDTTAASGAEFTLKLSAAKGSTMTLSSTMGTQLGFKGTTATSYLDTGKKMGDLKGLDWANMPAVKDADGNVVKDADGNVLYALTLNGKEVGRFTKDTALDSVLTAINNNSSAGVSVSYSKTTNEFQFKSKETGASGRVDFGSDPNSLGAQLFGGGTAIAGKDAIFTVTVNDTQMEMTRSTNSFNLEGLNLTLNKAFGYDSSGVHDATTEKVDFTSKADSDTIVKAIKSFVDDYNAMVTELREAFRTVPAQKSNGSKYDPLTDDDLASMSESAIKAYEEKAKQGILFADGDLSSLYNKLTSAISPAGSDGGDMRAIGLSTKYSGGLTTLDLDEEKLRAALDANPESVKQVFAKSKDGGAATDGLMQKLKGTLDTYASTSLATPGVLVRKAGTPLSTSSLKENAWQKQLNDFDDQIDRWTDKMSNRVDYYTRKFTQLEQLMSQMNSQSSSLMSFMGGGQ